MTRLAELVTASQRVGATASRLAKVAALAATLRRLAPEEIEIAVAYLSGETRQGKLGIAYATLGEARSAGARSASLDLRAVDGALDAIARTKGKGSAAERARSLGELFARATRAEQDFLVRLLVGELRQGALEGVMVDAIAEAAALPVADVRRAAMYAGGLPAVAAAALTAGAQGLAQFSIRLLQPVQPMLAQPADDIVSALDQQPGAAAVEWKLDGARVQVHKAGGDVRVFTRNLNDVTAAVPELVEAVRPLPARDLILDGETIALAPSGAPQPFQVTMRRQRLQRLNNLRHRRGDVVEVARVDRDRVARLVHLHACAVELPLQGGCAELFQRVVDILRRLCKHGLQGSEQRKPKVP